MRKFLLIFFILPLSLSAQLDFKNSVKVNAVGLSVSLFSLQYERMITPNLSFGTTVFYRPEKLIPFAHSVDDWVKKHSLEATGIDFEHIFVDEAKVGVKGFAPELRYYFGQAKNRFFIGAFGQYEDYDVSVPATIEAQYEGSLYELEKVPIDAKIRTISGGILIGTQFKIGERFVLDFVIIGPHFGSAPKVYAVVEQSLLSKLSETDKQFLENSIRQRFRLTDKYFDVAVTDDKAEMNAFKAVPYLGIRGFGLNFGWYF